MEEMLEMLHFLEMEGNLNDLCVIRLYFSYIVALWAVGGGISAVKAVWYFQMIDASLTSYHKGPEK